MLPELEVKSIALPQGRKSEERSAVETAGPQLAGQRRVEIGRPRAIGRGAQAGPPAARLVLLLGPAPAAADSSGQIQLALAAGKSRPAEARVAALLAEAAAAVQARVGVAQIDFRVADVVLPHTWTESNDDTFGEK